MEDCDWPGGGHTDPTSLFFLHISPNSLFFLHISPTSILPLSLCRWISCRKNTGYHAMDPKIRMQGVERDGSLETSNAQRTTERDTELYLGSGPSW
jgi:hypothetical protein